MDRSEYLNAVNEFFYQGEVLGEAFFAYCVEHETDPQRRYKWANLLQLETETKARLRPFLARLGLSLAQDDVSAQIAEITAGFGEKSWTQIMEEIAGITDFYLDKFRAIEAAAPEGERQMARSMLIHEAAINAFAKLEMIGDGANSLADVVSQLKWPVPPP
jgi:hypothetical protein